QPFVDEAVVCGEEVEDTPVFPQDALEEELGFATEITPEIFPEIREQELVGRRTLQRPQLQPLTSEVVRQAFGPRVGQHPLNLMLEDAGLAKGALDSRVQQLLVGNAAPEEERQARRELQVAHLVSGVRGHA